ncbi:hypothetical protein GOFOIKOB_6296 [Methylobacterium tardum]|nr:hypothetical protein GOFOIKOB_6296 [Methylobacterium tardum]
MSKLPVTAWCSDWRWLSLRAGDLDTLPAARHLERMPGQHGQTYDPQEEPAPQGGWFRLEERPYPERLDRAFRVLAACIGIAAAAAAVWMIAFYAQRPPTDLAGYGWAAVLVLMLAGLAYGFARAVGMILVGIYGTMRDGSEFVVDWRALRHDLPLRRTRVVLLEAGLLLASQAGALWGLALFVREGLAYGLAMFVLINAMTYWPFLRRWIQGRPSRP